MFPLLAILLAAGLLFKLKKKPVASVSTPRPTSAPATPKTTTTPNTTPKTTTAVKKPTVKAAPVVNTTASQVPSTFQTAGINDQLNDMMGQWSGSNPKVLNPTLPYGQYSPGTNSTGYQTPPVVQPTYR